jgi:protein-S-isoprenylcysteine O-methyltransferase Ste14
MVAFVFSLVVYGAFLTTFVFFVLFADGLVIDTTVDSGRPGPLGVALAVDVGLMLLFGLQHSIMARQSFKDAWTRVVPPHVERSAYVLASTVALALIIWLWRPLPGVVWRVDAQPWVALLWTLNALGWIGVPVSTFLIDHFDLFGLKQSFHAFRDKTYEPSPFVMPWLYRYVRHPMMTALLMGLWATPDMTVSHLVLSVGLSLYVVIGVHFEERGLARELGAAYVQYQASTPKFFPRLFARARRADVRSET